MEQVFPSQIDLMNQIRALQAQLAQHGQNDLTSVHLGDYPFFYIPTIGEGVIMTREGKYCRIKAKGRCDCGSNFEEIKTNVGFMLACKVCLSMGKVSVPARYFIELRWDNERVRIFSDNNGEVLSDIGRANDLSSEIDQKIKKNEFQPDDYKKKDYRKLAFRQYAIDWLWKIRRLVELKELSPAYLESNSVYVKKFLIPYFQDKDIRKFTAADINRFYLSLDKTLSVMYRQGILKKLRQMFKNAAEDGLIDIHQVPRFPKTSQPKVKKKYCSLEDQDHIFQYIPDEHKAPFLFIRNTGCRTSEALSLHMEDINFEKREVTICRTFSRCVLMDRPKEKRAKTIPLDDELFTMLMKIRRVSGFVFINPNTGSYYRKSAINRLWNKALKAAGVEYIKIHEWGRHSFITQSIQQGHDIYDIMKFVGHSKLSTTENYIQSLGDRLTRITRPARVIEIQKKRAPKRTPKRTPEGHQGNDTHNK